MNWDSYFLEVCNSIAKKSSCISRKIGAIIVRDNSIISTGYNGPARGIPHCGKDRFKRDISLYKEFEANYGELQLYQAEFNCPRKIMNFPSGEGMHWCTAQHAEENCISNAALNGVSTHNSTLYLNSVIPCKNCFSTLINSGIVEIVCLENAIYDKYSKFIIENSSIRIRKFNLC